MRIDLHTHSCVSDGTDTPSELVAKAVAAGLDVVALTDHDTFAGLPEAQQAAADQGLVLVPGVELSTRIGGRSVHLLGYCCRTDDVRLGSELERIRRGRDERIPGMIARLAELGLPLSDEEVSLQAHGASIGRPHIADAMVQRGYVANRDEAFTRYLADGGPAFVDRYAPEVADAIDVVHRAGGVAVIAHPWSRDGRNNLTEETMSALVASHGLEGIEVDHPDHDAATRAELRRIATRLGLLATGSSDYHGTGKTRNPLGVETTAPAVFALLQHAVVQRRAS